MRGCRVLVPDSMKNEVLNELHVGHFGVQRMKQLARSYCWWKGIDDDISKVSENYVNYLKLSKNPPKVNKCVWPESNSV